MLKLEQFFAAARDIKSLGAVVSCGPFGSNLLDTLHQEQGVLVVRPFNLKNCMVEKDNLVFISEESVKANNLKIYEEGTLLFSRVGDIKSGIPNQRATISPNIIAAEFDNADTAKFLAVFCQSKYSFQQLCREFKVVAQPTISTGIIERIKIPDFSSVFQQEIVERLDLSFELYNEAGILYTQAESLLLEELGLVDYQPNPQNIAIRSLKDSFVQTGRLNAEYYQPKYDELLDKIKNYAGGYKKLGDCVTLKKGIEVGAEAY